MATRTNDPVTLEIIQNSLQSAADEMFAAMKKTSMSSIIYEVLDMGTGVMDADGELASSGAGIPAFIGVLDKATKVIAEKFMPSGNVRPGDVFATNDPYYGGVTHLNDIVVVMPVFAEGRVIAWTANIAHNSDVGGMAPGSLTGDATEIFQEGLRLPAIRIIAEGEPIRPVFEIIKVNSRMPEVLEGDVWAAVASVRIGANRLQELAEKYGAHTFEEAMASFMDFGEKVSLAELPRLPKGTFELSEEQEDGRIFNVAITISEDEFLVDLRNNPDQASDPVNTSRDGVLVAAQMILKSLTDPYSPANSGSFRPLKVLTREGTIFHAKEPAAIGFYYELELRVYDLMWRCLAQHMPERFGGHFASVCGTFIAIRIPADSTRSSSRNSAAGAPGTERTATTRCFRASIQLEESIRIPADSTRSSSRNSAAGAPGTERTATTRCFRASTGTPSTAPPKSTRRVTGSMWTGCSSMSSRAERAGSGAGTVSSWITG